MISFLRKNTIPLIVLILICFWALKSLFQGPFFTSQDGIHQTSRLFYYKESLKDGVFPPRWANHAFYNFGYPLFQFNYQFPWYVATPFLVAKLNIFDTIKILHTLAYFISGVFMYLFLFALTKQKTAALMGTILFLVSPYRFLNIYVRNSVGEVFAYMFIPLVFLAIWKLGETLKPRFLLLFAFALYGLLLSHAISFVLFSLSITVFWCFTINQTKNRKKFFWFSIVAFMIFIGMSAYYLLPALLEKKFTWFESRFKFLSLKELVSLKRVIYSPWGYAGNSVNEGGTMSFQFGITNWLVLIISLLVSGWFYKKQVKNFQLIVILISALIMVISIFLVIEQSAFFWSFFGRIFQIDFPWKFIGVAVFWSAIALALLFQFLPENKKILAVAFILALVFYTNRNHIRVNQYIYYDIQQAAYFDRGTNTEDEYLPKWVKTDYRSGREVEIPQGNVIKTKGEYVIADLQDKSSMYSYTYSGSSSTQLIRKFYFPGWQVFLNDRPINFDYSRDGFYFFQVPKGKSKIAIVYKGTVVVNVATAISLFSWFGCLWFFLKKVYEKLVQNHHC